MYKLLQWYPTLYDPMDQSPAGSSVHGILQARILEWIVISVSRGFFPTQRSNCLPCLLHWQGGSSPLAPPGKLILSTSLCKYIYVDICKFASTYIQYRYKKKSCIDFKAIIIHKYTKFTTCYILQLHSILSVLTISLTSMFSCETILQWESRRREGTWLTVASWETHYLGWNMKVGPGIRMKMLVINIFLESSLHGWLAPHPLYPRFPCHTVTPSSRPLCISKTVCSLVYYLSPFIKTWYL